jgi:hypothetical protein
VVACLGEVGLLGLLPRVRTFRQRVDAHCERAEAAAVRGRLLERMGAPHRAELEQIERLAVAVRKRCGLDRKEPATVSDLAVEQWLEIDSLLALYVQIAVAHRDVTGAFPIEDQMALVVSTEQVLAIAHERAAASDGSLERRAAILQRRRETWTLAARERDLLAQQLSTIVDLVHWMHELCAVTQGGSVRLTTEQVLASWEPSGDALREVSTLCRTDGHLVDPAVLALGRDELARRAQAAYTARLNWEADRPSAVRGSAGTRRQENLVQAGEMVAQEATGQRGSGLQVERVAAATALWRA